MTDLDLAAAKLASSGLSLSDARALGIDILSAAATRALGPWAEALPTLRLNYFDVGSEPLIPWPAHPPFFRLRYLGDPDPSGFGAQTKKKPQRYTQAPNTAVAAYLARGVGVDWLDVLSDASQALLITEGELKAACACVRGFPTIGSAG